LGSGHRLHPGLVYYGHMTASVNSVLTATFIEIGSMTILFNTTM
jgi:hypothetical protein